MPTYEITSPEGEVYEVDAPDGATEEQVFSYFKQNYQTVQPEGSKKEPSFLESVDAFGRGAAQYTSLGFDPELRAFGRSLGSGRPYSETYKEVTGELEAQKQKSPTAYGVGETTGAIATAMAAGPTSAAKTFLGRTAQQAGAGALLEGITGAGQAEGDLYDRFKAGVKQGTVGALTSAGTSAALEGVGKAVSGAYRGLIAPKSSQQAITEAIQSGAPVSAGQVMGGASAATEGYLSQMASGQGLRELGENQGKYLEGQAAGLFKVKIPSTTEEAGQSIITGLKKSSERYIQRKNRMYDSALKNVPDTTAFVPQKTRQIINQIIGQGQGNAALSKLISAPEFKIIDEALSGNVNLGQAKKALKGAVWDIVKKYEDQPNLSRQFKDIYFAIDDDILGSVNAIDPLAAGKLKAADTYMSERMKMNERLAKIFDPSKGANETAAKAYYKAVGMATDGRAADKDTLLTLKKALPREEFDEFRSFFFSNLGRETAGQAGVVANIIPRKFLTDVNKITPEAKNILLDAPQRTALQKMAEYAEIVSPVTLNKSGTAGGVADISSIVAGGTINPWFLALPIGNYIYGKSYNTPAGKMLVRAVNKLPREIMTSPPNQTVRNAIRGQLLSMGASESIINEIDSQFEQPPQTE